MDTHGMLQRVEELVRPALSNLGYELIERELVMDAGRWVLRLFIDKDGGITIDDCEKASRGVDTLIEVEEIVPVGYTLEVSSPGINRPLRYRKDFEKFSGAVIRLKTLNPVNGRSNYKGTLDCIEGDDILMTVDGSQYRIPFRELARARMEGDVTDKKEKTVH